MLQEGISNQLIIKPWLQLIKLQVIPLSNIMLSNLRITDKLFRNPIITWNQLEAKIWQGKKKKQSNLNWRHFFTCLKWSTNVMWRDPHLKNLHDRLTMVPFKHYLSKYYSVIKLLISFKYSSLQKLNHLKYVPLAIGK